MKFRPCIDLHHGQVKQIVGGTLSDHPENLRENFVSEHDSSYYAELFKRDGLTGGHVIMLGPGNEAAALQALRAYPGGMQIGGGITDENAEYYLENGASHVIVTSFVFKNGAICFENLKKLVAKVGQERLVLDLSCRKKGLEYYVVTDRWQKFTNFTVTPEHISSLSQYCAEFLIHAVDVEGLCNGILPDLVKILAACPDRSITYAGGIRSMEDIEAIRRFGQGRIDFTVGSALEIFGGSLSYEAIVRGYGRG